jgi:hypothetical protein
MKFNPGRGVIYAHIKMKTILWCGMNWGQNVGGFHPIDSSLTSREKTSFFTPFNGRFSCHLPMKFITFRGISIHENYTITILFYTV